MSRVEANAGGLKARIRGSVITASWALLFIGLAIGTELLTVWSAARSDPDGGADIGLSLFLLAAWALAGALAGGVDGWWSTSSRRGPSGVGLAVRWMIVGLAAGFAAAVYRSVDDSELRVVSVLANFGLSTIGESVLVAGPAILTAVVTKQLAAGAPQRQQHQSPPPAAYIGPWNASG